MVVQPPLSKQVIGTLDGPPKCMSVSMGRFVGPASYKLNRTIVTVEHRSQYSHGAFCFILVEGAKLN